MINIFSKVHIKLIHISKEDNFGHFLRPKSAISLISISSNIKFLILINHETFTSSFGLAFIELNNSWSGFKF